MMMRIISTLLLVALLAQQASAAAMMTNMAGNELRVAAGATFSGHGQATAEKYAASEQHEPMDSGGCGGMKTSEPEANCCIGDCSICLANSHFVIPAHTPKLASPALVVKPERSASEVLAPSPELLFKPPISA